MIVQQTLFDLRHDVQLHFDVNIPFVMMVSGGKDSTALLFWMKAHYPHNPMTAMYHDTGFEHPGVLQYIRQLTQQLAIPLVVTQPVTDLLSLIARRGQIPGFGCRYCTAALKVAPGGKWLRNAYPEGLVIQCFGFRAEESPLRAKKQILETNVELCTRKRTVLNFAPLLEWRTANVIDFIEGNGFQLFPTYRYLSRLSCRYCFLAGKREHEASRINDPEGFEQVQIVLDKIKTKELPNAGQKTGTV